MSGRAAGESAGGKLRRHPIAVWSVAPVFVLTMPATRYVAMVVSPLSLTAELNLSLRTVEGHISRILDPCVQRGVRPARAAGGDDLVFGPQPGDQIRQARRRPVTQQSAQRRETPRANSLLNA